MGEQGAMPLVSAHMVRATLPYGRCSLRLPSQHLDKAVLSQVGGGRNGYSGCELVW